MGILDKAIKMYGERQLDQAQEELAELIVAISKYKRAVTNRNGEMKSITDALEVIAVTNVVEEIADVRIMIKQVMMILNISEVEVANVEIAKLNRLEKRMKSNE